jgi:nicotinate-nucleotide adenylyltransferase
MRGSLAVYGGTFDPVHYGHLRSAIEIRQALCVDTVCLVPSYMPPHRQQPDSTPEQRLEMLRLAIDEHAGLKRLSQFGKRLVQMCHCRWF